MYKARVSHGVLISNPKYTVYEFREWENKVLRIIFGLQYRKVIRTRRKLHSEEFRVTLHPLRLLGSLNQEGSDCHYIWYVRERDKVKHRTLVGKLGRHGCKCEDNIKASLKDRKRVFTDSSILQQELFADCCRYASVKGVESTGQPTDWLQSLPEFCTTKLAGPNGVLKHRIVEFRVSKFSNFLTYAATDT